MEQALIGRLIALPVNITSARPYGLFRDKIFTTLQLNAESPVWKRTIADSAAMLMFQTCTYAGILTTAGLVTGKPFTLIEIGTAVLTVAPVMLVIGRPFAWIRNFIRKNIFKLQNVD